MGKKTDGQVVHPKKKHNDTNPDCVTSVSVQWKGTQHDKQAKHLNF